MTAFADSDQAVPTPDVRVLHAATAACLGRYRGQSRLHTRSDLKIYLTWCAGHDLDPLRVGRADIEQYVRWLQEIRCYQPSTVSRRLSVVVGFNRTCVIDQILPFSPADYVRRPPVPAESPTLDLGHLQFEALITTARLSANINDFALIAISASSVCGSSKSAAPASATSARNTATACSRSAAKATRSG
jgi:hypothetical protein